VAGRWTKKYLATVRLPSGRCTSNQTSGSKCPCRQACAGVTRTAANSAHHRVDWCSFRQVTRRQARAGSAAASVENGLSGPYDCV
jgi:hypothetical protein